MSVTFFSSARRTLGQLEISEDKLIANNDELKSKLELSSNGLDSIDSNAYDAFFVIGGQKIFAEDNRLSAAVKKLLMEDGFKTSVGAVVVLRLRQITQKPIWFSPNPLKAHFDDYIQQWNNKAIAFDDRINMLSEVLSEIDVSVFAQPKETRNSEFSTSEKFARQQPTSTQSKRNGGDRAHMNEAYGVIYMRAFAQHLSAQLS
ncbi:hypothetical protein GCM10008927_11850 [Amylibacter ulvae]|uniref:Uncharacterized protein n=1 Tax=Paramylibacter ulvae TaxID=1651968 RepID=A0ABQ3CXD1_9RHOB|nr:hypothetical protein [Amylibacter ulvae]GHA48406.1 hypothetical protein GCM10008927_11850 [Amylibacter ulvae]